MRPALLRYLAVCVVGSGVVLAGGCGIIPPWDTSELPTIQSLADINSHRGQRVRLVGEYQQVDIRKGQRPGGVQYRGHVVIELRDTHVLLESPGTNGSIRSHEEIRQFDDQRVVVVGTILSENPPDPENPHRARIINPCLVKVESIALVRNGTP